MHIIVKGSGYDARKRVVRLQKDLINRVNRIHETDSRRTQDTIRDFKEMSWESGVFKTDGKGIREVTTIEGKEDKQGGVQIQEKEIKEEGNILKYIKHPEQGN